MYDPAYHRTDRREGTPHPVVLTVAGSDPGGGAGIQADLKTFHRFGVYGTAAVTLITVQNTMGVARVEFLDAALVRDQIEAVLEDLPPAAIKTGALGSEAVVRGRGCLPIHLPADRRSGAGQHQWRSAARYGGPKRIARHFITPSCAGYAEPGGGFRTRGQGSANAGRYAECRAADRRLWAQSAVLIKGGHLEGDALDIAF